MAGVAREKTGTGTGWLARQTSKAYKIESGSEKNKLISNNSDLFEVNLKVNGARLELFHKGYQLHEIHRTDERSKQENPPGISQTAVDWQSWHWYGITRTSGSPQISNWCALLHLSLYFYFIYFFFSNTFFLNILNCFLMHPITSHMTYKNLSITCAQTKLTPYFNPVSF